LGAISIKQLLEAGVHFGHQTRRWNPKMKPFIFGKRNGVHIIDLQKTLQLFKEAVDFLTQLAAQGKTVLFVGTKSQAQETVEEEARRCGMLSGGGSVVIKSETAKMITKVFLQYDYKV